ncbi:MAG: hypothetical protein LAP85_04965 [Acidobacteriia bacterium]|nr:hypothetical protein [Terriglobia bacterium]
MSKRERSKRESVIAGPEVSESTEIYSRQLDAARSYLKKWAESAAALEDLWFPQLQELDEETARKMMSDLFDM